MTIGPVKLLVYSLPTNCIVDDQIVDGFINRIQIQKEHADIVAIKNIPEKYLGKFYPLNGLGINEKPGGISTVFATFTKKSRQKTLIPETWKMSASVGFPGANFLRYDLQWSVKVFCIGETDAHKAIENSPKFSSPLAGQIVIIEGQNGQYPTQKVQEIFEIEQFTLAKAFTSEGSSKFHVWAKNVTVEEIPAIPNLPPMPTHSANTAPPALSANPTSAPVPVAQKKSGIWSILEKMKSLFSRIFCCCKG